MFLAPALLAVALLLAPPDSNFFWGMNGLRSLSPVAGVVVVVLSVAAASLSRVSLRPPIARGILAALVAWLIAFPLREKIHYLGDTQLRIRALSVAGAGMIPLFASWWARLHANPLDIVVDILGVAGLQALGVPVLTAVSIVSWTLAILFFALAYRLAGRLSSDPAARVGLTAALALSGVVVAFAGYAESAGLVAVTTIWWWAEALAPLDTRAQAWRTVAAFIAVALAHRVGIVMALPLLWRALGPPLDRDDPATRRTLFVAGIVAIALLIVVSATTGTGRQLTVDIRDLIESVRTGHAHVSDIANALVLVFPLALMAPFVAGRVATTAWVRDPRAIALLIAAAPLVIVLVVIYPHASYTLGPEREWEANLMPALTLTTAGAMLLAGLERTRRRTALALVLPVLMLCALGWLLVHADEPLATRRAFAMAEHPSTLTDFQRANLHAFLGQRAMDLGQPEVGARELERAFDLGGNGRRALMASEAWLEAGNPDAARRALAKARALGSLGPELEAGARRIEQMLGEAVVDSARDSTRSAAGPRPH
jgi:hypothetical protein